MSDAAWLQLSGPDGVTVLGHTTSPEVADALADACLDECAQLSLNLTGGVYVNQTAAFSDLHGTGGNPAANAALVDGAFVTPRFRVVEIRRPLREDREDQEE